jgi:group II intron reverse transcriptase/maturase
MEVWKAWEKVRSKKGAAGVDGQSIDDFERDVHDNLYKIWNRMSSGSYFPPPVRAVEIPKAHAPGTRTLGVPSVGDRVAQTVVAARLEARMEEIFHRDSYGYRRGRSPEQAVARTRERCWRMDWVVDMDIQRFFDSVPWDLMVKAVEANTDQSWIVLYVKRWLAAPMVTADGTVVARERGTPQGSAVSPALANLFLHYALDSWLVRTFPDIQFARYVDDAVVHCVSEARAIQVRDAIAERMEQVGLRLHPDKTRIVYCQDGRRRGEYEHTSFTFLGFTFQQRCAQDKHGNRFSGFNPARSDAAQMKMNAAVREWKLHRRTTLTLDDLAHWINPIVRGWMQYYGAFYRSKLHPLLARINSYLMRFLRKKFKRLRGKKKAIQYWKRLVARRRGLFAHWKWVNEPTEAW